MDTQAYAKITEKEASVLRSLATTGRMHGLGIVRASDGRISRGSIYYVLGRLEEKGLVESRIDAPGKNPGKPRRLFNLTDPGAHSMMVWDAMQLAAETITASESWERVRNATPLTNLLILDAIAEGASEIFLNPGRGHGVVGVRIEGVRTERWRLPKKWLRPVLARIKLLSRLGTAPLLRRQEGKWRVQIGGQKYDLATVVSPVDGGERCVLKVIPSEHPQ